MGYLAYLTCFAFEKRLWKQENRERAKDKVGGGGDGIVEQRKAEFRTNQTMHARVKIDIVFALVKVLKKA